MSCSSSSASAVAEQEFDVDVEHLITLMHMRPPLWDKFHKSYSDRILKARLWEEVNQEVYFDWDKYTRDEKKQKGADIQKKWKNLKDTFFKELAAYKNVVSGQAQKKRKRPYIHYKALSFLSDQKSQRDTTSNIDHQTETTENKHNYSDEENDSEVFQNRRQQARMKQKAKEKEQNTDDELVKLLKEKKYDEDVSFCEMLIPMFRSLSKKQKHFAKIEILNVINRASDYSPETYMQPLVQTGLNPYSNSAPAPQAHNLTHTQSSSSTNIQQTSNNEFIELLPNTSFDQSYIVEGSGFDMKNYVLFKK